MKQVHINTLLTVNDKVFYRYGKKITELNVEESINIMSTIPLPKEGNEYIASFPSLENTTEYLYIKRHIFGDVDIQAGFCNGWKNSLNALEFHKSSELIIAVSDCVLILGLPEYLQNNTTYDTANTECFFIPQGTVVELYPRILHFAPCRVNNDGFRTVIMLPRETNDELSKPLIPSYLFKKNKWLLAHESAKWLCDKGAEPLLLGENIEIIS